MTENAALEQELAKEAFDRILNPIMPTNPYKIVFADDIKYRDVPIQTYSLGFKARDEVVRGRKQLLLAISDILRNFDFDTLAFRCVEYKIEEDKEFITLRCAFIKDGKEAKPID